ncbi:Beta-galactosidase C-terminal domain, partial [Planctomycetota bacterium]
RQGHGKKLLFLMNHTQQPKVVDIPEGKIELLDNTRTKKTMRLDRFDVAVVLLEP